MLNKFYAILNGINILGLTIPLKEHRQLRGAVKTLAQSLVIDAKYWKGLKQMSGVHGDHINSKIKIQDVPGLSRTFF